MAQENLEIISSEYHTWQGAMRNLFEQHDLYVSPTEINSERIKAGIGYKDYSGQVKNLYSIQTDVERGKPILRIEYEEKILPWLGYEVNILVRAYALIEVKAHQTQDYFDLISKFGHALHEANIRDKAKIIRTFCS